MVVKGDLRPNDDTLEPMGEVLGGRIYKIRGTAVFENEDEKFRIRTGALGVDGEEYVLEGMRLIDDLGQGIAFSLPFPSNGVRAFDAHHRPLPDKAAVFLDQLAGIRLHLFNGQDESVGRYQIKMELYDETLPTTSDIYFDKIRTCGKETLEIPLIDYADRCAPCCPPVKIWMPITLFFIFYELLV